ncbi:hypothetical protein [Aliiroseovarius sediminis]|uniref:hypothetical protein n=1 Tax=Aliiroseovarius sediminis TaxID=2925839 RepID=UPI001F5A24BA|nr:hypothetical protein [Aliiroseovarius sediminis]MCI2395263.1 hypothetical protein [Aliiroseovarius sediminis]
MRKFLLIGCIFSLGACAAGMEATPVVSQYNGDSVSIQLDGNQMAMLDSASKEEALRKADAEAARICSKGHKKRAEYTSHRNIPTSQYTTVVERLYLCLG